MRAWLGVAWVGLLVVVGCSDGTSDRPCADPRDCYGDGDVDADADGDVDADSDADGDGDTECVPSPDPTEVCDGLDNDCNGGVDEGILAAGTDVVLEPAQYDTTALIALSAGADRYGLLRLEGVNPAEPSAALRLSFSEVGSGGQVGTTVAVSDSPTYIYYDTLALGALQGGGWALAWGEAPNGVGNGRNATIVTAAVVDGVLSPQVALGDADALGEFAPSLAVGGDIVLVVWNDNEQSLMYAVVDPLDQTIVDSSTLASGFVIGGRLSVTWTGSTFLVATEVGADLADVIPVAPDGAVGESVPIGRSDLDSPVIAWDGVEAAVVRKHGADQLFSTLGGNGEGLSEGVAVTAGGTVQRLAGALRSFAMTAVVGNDPNHYYGVATFWNIGPGGGVSNEIALEDTEPPDDGARDVWAVPSEFGWAVAWIDGDGKVRMDFVECP